MTRILYIDDDPGLGRLVERYLTREGFEVALRVDGAAGVAAVADGLYDAVALDHYMPGQDGMTTLAAIRALPDPPPVVFVTGSEDSRLAIAALKAGAFDYVIKDVSGEFMALLARALEGAIDQRRERRAREAAERELAKALARAEQLAAQRQLLIEEINHRVANSLQLVASFLRLQANAIDDVETRRALGEARDRVFAVAAVHRRLYIATDGGNVAVSRYLGELIDDLRRAQATAQIDYQPVGDPCEVSLDHAVALGVIVGELVANAQKYAYPDGSGPIRVRLEVDSVVAVLAVEDDGVGIRQGEVKGSGLGSRIVESMAQHLAATLTYDAGHRGTRALLRFSVARDLLAA